MSGNLHVGDPAPDFALPSDSGETVRLADLRGRRVVVYFYPRDDTSGCTKEACNFRDARSAYEQLDMVVLGVSPDDVTSHGKFRDKYDLNFPLLADTDHSVAQAYGAWGKKRMYGREYDGMLRSTFVIGPDGTLERIYRNVKPAEHADQILADLAS